ncbi:MAG: hypothetical protein LBF15_06075 [Candidatus Peribacteria bacterium]|nr:hypothetical protein [Candidatus Peribacteria bacterium]
MTFSLEKTGVFDKTLKLKSQKIKITTKDKIILLGENKEKDRGISKIK